MASRIDYGYETWSEKFKRKFNENPWVPIGCLATTGALFMSAVKMRAGKSKDMQYWLRARVGLQGLTIAALVAGAMALQGSNQNKISEHGDGSLSQNEVDTETLRAQQKAKEKAEFEERLRNAEVVHQQEQAVARMMDETSHSEPRAAHNSSSSGSSWRSWFGWGWPR